MRLLSRSLGSASASAQAKALAALSGRPWLSALGGALAAALVQSSSTVTILLVGLVEARALSLDAAAAMVVGANVGTTVTAHVLAFRLGTGPALAVVAAGAALALIPGQGRRAGAVLGLGLLLLGVAWLEGGLAPLGASPWAARVVAAVRGSPLLGFFAGAAMTAVALSSGVTIGLLQGLAASGVVPVAAALPVLFGDNVGTTSDTLLAGLAAGRRGLGLALFHLAFNLATTALLLPLAGPLAALLPRLSPLPARQIAFAHTAFNLAGALLWLPFRRVLLGLAVWAARAPA